MRLFACILLFLVTQTAWGQQATIAVAANMKDAFSEIDIAFRASGKPAMRVVYGSSGNLTSQIMNGAPFSLLIAADERFPLELYKNSKAVDEGLVYAIGKLALISKSSSGMNLSNTRAGIEKAIKAANRIALAKPDLSPYGKATIEYLKAEGFWELAKSKLIYGDNIGVATMYVLTGAADIGFTAFSLAKSPELAKQSNHILLNSQSYEPIKQKMILLKGALPEAIELYRFMQGEEAKAVLQKYGYVIP